MPTEKPLCLMDLQSFRFLAANLLRDYVPLPSRGTGDSMNFRIGAAVGPRPRRVLSGLISTLLIACCGLLTFLAVLQDRTIDAQRDVIRLLRRNSASAHVAKSPRMNGLSAGGGHSARGSDKLQREQKQKQSDRDLSGENLSAGASSPQFSSPQNPAADVPSPSVPLDLSQAPSSQGKTQASTKPGRNSRKAQKALPVRPPAEVTDPSDMRRVSVAI